MHDSSEIETQIDRRQIDTITPGTPRRRRSDANSVAKIASQLVSQQGVVLDTPCDVWLGHKAGSGRGVTRYDGKSQMIDEILWRDVNGEIPAGHVLEALCGDKACATVAHHHVIAKNKYVSNANTIDSIRDRLASVNASDLVDTECFLWTGAAFNGGRPHGKYAAKDCYVDELLWEAANGPIPDGLVIWKTCDVPACCNLAHLYVAEPKRFNTIDDLMERVLQLPDTGYIETALGLRPNGCWHWQLGLSEDGYAVGSWQGEGEYMHRVFHSECNGPIPPGYQVDHLCADPNAPIEERILNRKCVRPEHLRAVTLPENVRSSGNVGGVHHRQTECIHGHEFTEANTGYFTDKRDRLHRRCKACAANYPRYGRAA